MPVCCLLLAALLAGCDTNPASTGKARVTTAQPSLAVTRQGFATQLLQQVAIDEPLAEPPSELFQLVTYDGPLGKMPAYLSPDPQDGKKHPLIVWLTGGFSNSIGDTAWLPADPENDQSASQYREAGLLMMFPSLRGGTGSPGYVENCCGEVEDVAAAAEWVKLLPYVDPDRVYLGGHSTGGTLVLLSVAYCNAFRGAIAFGPVGSTAQYGQDNVFFDCSNPVETRMRAPVEWLNGIRTPTLVIEGSEQGNAASLRVLAEYCSNTNVTFHEIPGANHFDILAPANRLLADSLKADTGPNCSITLDANELASEFAP